MTELQQYLGSYFGLSGENMDDVTALFQKETLKKGSFFTRQGTYCEKLSFVQSGYIRIFANQGDKEVTQWISPKGYFVTDLSSFIFSQRSRWNMQALTSCNLYTIHTKEYKQISNIVPNWAEIEKRFISACFITLEDRVFNHLSLNAEERYKHLFEQNTEIFNQVPLHYLASMLGMSAETLSRIRGKKIS